VKGSRKAKRASISPFTITGTLRLGGMRQPRDQHQRLTNPDLRQLLATTVPADTVIEAEDGAEITIVDADVHHLKDKPTEGQLGVHAAAVLPEPDAWWMSHNHGLKLCYIGPQHRARAVAAALELPKLFHVEILAHTRHPLSSRRGIREGELRRCIHIDKCRRCSGSAGLNGDRGDSDEIWTRMC
jgi:hypothetical protein